MNDRLIWWGVQFSLNFLDFVMLYVIAHALMKKYIKITRQQVVFGVIYTFAVAPVFYFFDGYIARFLSHLVLMIMIKLMIKRSEISDLLLIYIFSFLMFGIIQTPIVSIVWLLNQAFELGYSITLVIAQILTAIAVVPVCRKFNWNKHFYAIHANIVLKLILFIFASVFLTILSILNFEYQIMHFLSFLLLILLVGLVLFPVMMKIHQYRIKSISTHDAINSLLSTAVSMIGETDPEVMRNLFKKHASDLGVDLNQLDTAKAEADQVHMDTMREKANTFIEMKVKKHDKAVEISSDVLYHKDYIDVDFQLAIKWLGVLLDNAIEATDTQPIYIDFIATTRRLSIRVANEYLGDNGQDIHMIFEKGYSTKGEGRGVGLHQLHQAVTELGGKVEVDEYYTQAHNCHYVQLSIWFEKEDVLV